MTGIRLASGAPVPPAPSLGTYRPVTAASHHLGSVTETSLTSYVPVCAHPDCWAALEPSISEHLAVGALYRHWAAAHPREAA